MIDPGVTGYEALREKVDAFAREVTARREDVVCRAGCSGCCHARLSVSDVEADALRAALSEPSPEARARLEAQLERPDDDPRCVLLGDDGRCAAYAGRPLVCRTQGLPLRYPAGTVPVEALRASAGGDVTWCPLNFESAPPEPGDVLDAERVDVMLALVNREHTSTPTRRTPIETIVLQLLRGEGSD